MVLTDQHHHSFNQLEKFRNKKKIDEQNDTLHTHKHTNHSRLMMTMKFLITVTNRYK